MIKQWERGTKRKLNLITIPLPVRILSGGSYAYTYTTAVRTIKAITPTVDFLPRQYQSNTT
ncbi:hypothetical protein ACFLW4_04510 [Chloroflexota bacterium]